MARPTDGGQGREGTATDHQPDTDARPHQATRCGNQPPRVAFPSFPPRPSLPAFLAPDSWVQASDGARSARTVRGEGRVSVGERSYEGHQAVAGG